MCELNIFEDLEERDDVVGFYRDELGNAMPNLCITSKDTNKKKGRATMNALGEMMIYSLTNYGRPDVRALEDICSAAFNVPIVDTYIDQLHDEGLSRKSTKAIRRETGQALRRWKNVDHITGVPVRANSCNLRLHPKSWQPKSIHRSKQDCSE
ncbi:hypothetical protein PPTG_06834 [Phytophthora nicotianae INRA-310]|uniref:Uncharacterized protein n=1 Tax=Phytophthora nicotianae (strain INRA-310) TaxID=761204 RepID=W2QSX0_PHYN3|nr:hypothetical protein PPTG_06834 [Phytophthora nicotianae INRA-310]ETN15594.1 hypothetical protein PPTG_06834 [Phytophthora nicotianae INRA-310]